MGKSSVKESMWIYFIDFSRIYKHSATVVLTISKMQDAGVLDENFQPDHLSWTKKGYLAYQIAFKLGITRV